MGMDYSYAGSASYPRFDREICEVAKVFGGIETDYLKERRSTEDKRPLGYWFGFLSSDNSNNAKFVFPDGTNEILVKWFNDLYGDFTVEETKVIWEYISAHPKIKDISGQLWYELETLTELDDSWHIW